jgi:hypothetical protein
MCLRGDIEISICLRGDIEISICLRWELKPRYPYPSLDIVLTNHLRLGVKQSNLHCIKKLGDL